MHLRSSNQFRRLDVSIWRKEYEVTCMELLGLVLEALDICALSSRAQSLRPADPLRYIMVRMMKTSDICCNYKVLLTVVLLSPMQMSTASFMKSHETQRPA